jgi:dihydroneopterin aldolase
MTTRAKAGAAAEAVGGRTRSAKPTGAATPERRIYLRDLVLQVRVGVHQHERLANQRVRLNLELVVDDPAAIDDDLENVVCYATLVMGIRGVVGARHVNLIETLADDIAAFCLADQRVRAARVRLDKLDVFPEAESVGVEVVAQR